MSDNPEKSVASAGLPGASSQSEDVLRQKGIDPDRLSILHLGSPQYLWNRAYPPWVRRMLIGLLMWLTTALPALADANEWIVAGWLLFSGVLILQGACAALVSASERLAARYRWDHYVAGSIAEILATLPELVVIGFIIPVSPQAAFVVALITIYNNALVFSLYSYFLPKDQFGRFLMPRPITEAGTQILIAGAAIGLVMGLVMMAFAVTPQPKNHFTYWDLIGLGVLLLSIFAVYVFKLVHDYRQEEQTVRQTLEMNQSAINSRIDLVYQHVGANSLWVLAGLFLAGIVGAVIGGHLVGRFAELAIKGMGLSDILTALILAGFAGMSEYVILWQTHRKKEYGIALANAFGGITQVMFLVLPFTLVSIGLYQGFVQPFHPDLPLPFNLGNIFLLSFLFPTFFVLLELLEKDHTLGLLDATIMTGIFLLLIVLLVAYGG